MRTKPIPLETVLDINEPRMWSYIPGFRGYELSDDGYVRSTKNFNVYPYGMLLRPVSSKDGNTFILSNDDNKRIRISVNQLKELVKNDKFKRAGFPRSTVLNNASSRNQQAFIKREPKPRPSDEKFMPRFTIVHETEVISKGNPLYDLRTGGDYLG